MRADSCHEVIVGWKNMQSVKSAWTFLYTELNVYILTLLQGNNKGRKTKTQTHTFNW